MADWLKHIIDGLTTSFDEEVKISLRPPIDIQSNRLHDIWIGERHWIAKEYLKSDEFADAPRREFDALSLLADKDIAPQPIHFEPHTSDTPPIVVYEYMEGVMWDRHKPSPAELEQLAQAWLAVHAVTRDDLWISRNYDRSIVETIAMMQGYFMNYQAWAERYFKEGLPAVNLCMDILHQRRPIFEEIAAMKPPLYFCKSDPRFANVIRRPDGRIAFVDWEDSGLRDPARDLADLFSHPNQEDLLSPDDWGAFLRVYLAEMSRKDADLDYRIRLYLAIFPIFWMSLLMNRIAQTQNKKLIDWSVNGLEGHQRLERIMGRMLAWSVDSIFYDFEPVSDYPFFPR